MQRQGSIIHKCIPEELKSMTQFYLFVCFEHKDCRDRWEVVVWDLVTFERFYKEIKATEFIKYSTEFGTQNTVESLAKFIEIDPSCPELSLNPGITEYFKRNKEELKKKKAQRE